MMMSLSYTRIQLLFGIFVDKINCLFLKYFPVKIKINHPLYNIITI